MVFVSVIFFTAESQVQNKSTMVMVAVVGVAVILLVVVAVLLLRKRLVKNSLHIHSQYLCHSDKRYLHSSRLCYYVPQAQGN